MSRTRIILGHIGYVLLWSILITAAGSLFGALIFPLIGSLAGVEATVLQMALSGARQLGFLTFIWAVGIAIVMDFQRTHRKRKGASTINSPAVRRD